MGKKQQHGLKAAVGPKPAASLGRSSKQLFLDLGQHDFSASKCAVCGMVYAKGHEEDEKLHKSFHSSAVQGLRFQGWTQERLVLLEPLAGRLLMLLPNDPAAHIKKVQEVCSFIEKAHGLSSGWLMAAPQCKVFLYVSVQKRVVGLAVVEPIKHAYKLAAPGPVDQEVDSGQLAAGQQQQRQQQCQGQPGAAAAAGPCGSSMDVDKPPPTSGGAMGPPQQQQQQRPLLWAGLHRSSSNKRSRLQALLPAGRAASAGGANTQAHSTGRLHRIGAAAGGAGGISISAATTSYTAGGSSAVKADSCPPSLLMAAELMQVGSAAAAAQQEQQQLGVGAPEEQREDNLLQQGERQQEQESRVAQQNQQLEVLQRVPLQPLNVQQDTQQQQQQQEVTSTAVAGSKAPGAGGSSSKSGGSGSGWGGGTQCGGSSVPSTAATPKAAAEASGAGVSLSWGGRSGGGAAAGSGGSSRARSGAAGAAAESAGACMVADKRRAVRAMLGVCMVWVSSEQRRKGMATKLLDAARCNMVPGYVVPRSQLAFTQPTQEGAKLAAAFTGTQQFMVYGIE